MEKALQLSIEYPWVIVLKNNRTLVAVNGNAYTNSTGNAGLAKGGSGDVLSGMILSLLAQGYNSSDAAQIAVYLHGLAADIAVKSHSLESLLASDVIEAIGPAFNNTRLKIKRKSRLLTMQKYKWRSICWPLIHFSACNRWRTWNIRINWGSISRCLCSRHSTCYICNCI